MYDKNMRYAAWFLIALMVSLGILMVAQSLADPVPLILDSSSYYSRLNGSAGTEVTGIQWCSLLADGDAKVVFFSVEYNGSGAVYDSIPGLSTNGLTYIPLRANIPLTYSFSTSYVDSVRVQCTTASEVILIWR
jgi:hypothetical protein